MCLSTLYSYIISYSKGHTPDGHEYTYVNVTSNSLEFSMQLFNVCDSRFKTFVDVLIRNSENFNFVSFR